jgi:hypothetical protein
MKNMALVIIVVVTGAFQFVRGSDLQMASSPFQISPGDATKVSFTAGRDQHLQITLSHQRAASFYQLTRENVGRILTIEVVEPNADNGRTTINASALFLKKPVSSGVVDVYLSGTPSEQIKDAQVLLRPH